MGNRNITVFVYTYMKKFLLPMFVSAILLFGLIGVELYKPILIGETIDNILTKDHFLYKVVDEPVEGSITVGNLKLLKVSMDDDANAIYVVVMKNPIDRRYILITDVSYGDMMGLYYQKNNYADLNKKIEEDELEYQDISSSEIKLVRSSDIQWLIRNAGIFCIVVLVGICFEYAHRIILHNVTQKILVSIRLDLYKKLHQLSMTFFNKKSVGDIITTINHDTEVLSILFNDVIINALINILSIVSILVVMFVLNVKLALYISIVVAIMIVLTMIYRSYSKNSWVVIRGSISNLNVFLSEHISAIKTIKIYLGEKQILREFDTLNTNLKNAQVRFLLIFGLFPPTLSFMHIVLIALVVGFGSSQVAVGGMTVGTIVIFIYYINKLDNPIQELSEQLSIFQSALVSAEKINEILSLDEIEIDKGQLLLSQSDHIDIEFEDVWFRYGDDQAWAIKHTSFKIANGETIALIGSTGSGKSTIIKLLTRFYEVDQGKILLNGICILDYDKSDLRTYFGQMIQDKYIFRGTLLENIKMFREDITDKQVFKLSKKIGAHDFIEKLPNKYLETIGDGGTSLSAGQSQIVGIMRTLVGNPRAIIFDEATASIDPISERLLQVTMDELMKERTAIIIAHRMSTIRSVDKLVVVEGGCVRVVDGSEAVLDEISMRENIGLNKI